MEFRGVRTTCLLGDWRDGDDEPSRILDPNEAVVFMLADDVPDLAGMLVAKGEGRVIMGWRWNWHGW
jgi:hypothetical protein